MDSVQVNNPGLASLEPILWKRSTKARYLSLRVKDDGVLHITLPGRVSQLKAIEFVLSKRDWIANARQKQQKRQRTGVELSADQLPALRKQARKQLGERLEFLAGTHGFSYEGLRLQWMKSRWGSCSSKNGISLNLALMFLPSELQDYVILHELCHTRVRNHSARFWALLDEHTYGRARELAKGMRGYTIGTIEK